jgi:hypothetical protein
MPDETSMGNRAGEEQELTAICFRCGLERTDHPLVHGNRLAACLACGETRLIVDVRPAREPQMTEG